MEVSATTKYVKMSPTKARDLANEIKGLPVADALRITEFNARKAAVQIGKTLKSAIANANEQEADVRRLVVSEAKVDEGPFFRRFRPKDRGRAHQILKRMSHITVVVEER